MSFGFNFDFESYCIVGDIVVRMRNVYSETGRYNYAPIFSLIQGILYWISSFSPNGIDTYRVLIVILLTGVDLGITYFILQKYGVFKACFFFLNPVSIIITGFHNQFDNIAILLMLIAFSFINEKREWNRRDIGFLFFASLSLMTKHIFFIMPVWIFFKKGLPLIKKAIYTIIPPIVFLFSFVPYIVNNESALQGILNNVFRYRSYNNAPLLCWFYDRIGMSGKGYFIVFCFIMFIIGLVIYKENMERHFQVYLMSLLMFSSAITDQYLAIPMYAVCTINNRLGIIYIIITGYYLLNSEVQLNLNLPLHDFKLKNGYFFACLILCLLLLTEIIKKFYQNTNITKKNDL